jgi:Leucine-rich repeat (LRR) protein
MLLIRRGPKMGKWLKAIAGTMLILMMVTSFASCGETGVHFADLDLEEQVRMRIGKQVGDIYQQDLEKLSSLLDGGARITDLRGLEHCTSLTDFGLSDNQINDINPLENLNNFETLGLLGNQIVDITPLSGLTRLTHLQLADNRISDLTPLSNITNLMVLNLNGNQIGNISPLGTLTALDSL